MKYSVYKPTLSGNEKKYVNQCLDTTWISSKGEFVTRFEQEFAKYIGVKYATATCNGTVPIHMALLALGIGKGDEVIVPSFTYVASVNPILWVGAKPIFADSLADTFQINPDDIEKKINKATKAIIIVHLYGHPCDMDKIMKIVKKHKLYLIEDVAEAFGSKYKNKSVGSFGDIATFSFFGNKTITCGEGGMAVTNDIKLLEAMKKLKNQGLSTDKEYWHDAIGYNYRMTNIAAAIGLAQLEKADNILSKKRKISDWYYKNLGNIRGVRMLRESQGVINSYWMITIFVSSYKTRDGLREYLKNKGIETRPTFYPVHTFPMYKKGNIKLPVSETISKLGLNLPSHPSLSNKDVKYICDNIRMYLCNEKQ